jgi:NAD(P)-dependent dehydrogenase (short-subunit alcohol dehydrogenase family)
MPITKPAALITGGAKGIGRAIARHLLSSGWQVGIIDLPDGELRRASSRQRGVLVIEGDVRNEETASDAVDAMVHRFRRLDAVVSNAGIMIRKPLVRDGNRINNLVLESACFHVAYVAKNSLLFSTVLIH